MADHQLHAARGGRVEAGDQNADPDAVDQHDPLQVQADPARRHTGQDVVDRIPHDVSVVQIDLAAWGDLDGAVNQLAGRDRQIHSCPLPGVPAF
jgi:hypothetical protein